MQNLKKNQILKIIKKKKNKKKRKMKKKKRKIQAVNNYYKNMNSVKRFKIKKKIIIMMQMRNLKALNKNRN